MNDSMYEEYMRSVLGYIPTNYRDTYDMSYGNSDMYDTVMASNVANMSMMSSMKNEELENCYPDIYRIVYPMVQRACNQNTKTVTRELVDSMTDEIYFAVEDNELAQTRGKEESSTKENQNTRNSTSSNSLADVREDRQKILRNSNLRDLIRILLLREFLGRPGVPGRPPIRPRPPMRPPMRPHPRGEVGIYNKNREYFSSLDDGYDLYEY